MATYQRRQSVLWTQRVIVLGVLIGLIWGVISFIGFIAGLVTGGSQQSQPTMKEGDPCQPQQIVVESFVGTATKQNQLAFNPGEKPYFWFQITNTGPVKCSFNVGTSGSFFFVKSGSEAIWNSKDCNLKVKREDTFMLLNRNEPVSSPASDWQRVRSSSSGCSIEDGQPAVTANGASYLMHAEVNGVISQNTVQFVLN